MSELSEILGRAVREWGIPRAATHEGWTLPVKLSCTIEPYRILDSRLRLPAQIDDFYSNCSGALLMADKELGQWGLNLFSFDEMLIKTNRFFSERNRDSHQGDLIVGRFLGDSDLLLTREREGPNNSNSVLIVEPLLPRKDWPSPAADFASFLNRYLDEQGRKYWERSAGHPKAPQKRSEAPDIHF